MQSSCNAIGGSEDGPPLEQCEGTELVPVNATQSSIYHADEDMLGAGNCIDGSTCTDERYEICHTNRDTKPWIAIDYGTSVTVQRVQLWSVGNQYAHRTRNLDIRIADEVPTSSDQMFSGGHLLGHFVGPATVEQ